MVRGRGREKQPKGHLSAALIPPTSTSRVSHKTPIPEPRLLSPLHPDPTPAEWRIAAITPHCLPVDSHNFAISGDSNDSPLLLVPPLPCLRHWANSYMKTWQINTTEYNGLFACSKVGFPNGTGTYVATFKNPTVFISQSASTYHAFYSQWDFKRNGCIKQLCLLTCKLLLALCAPHFLIFRLHFEKQSKKLQSSSRVQFCSRMSLILGSKKAISTSMATTCGSKQAIRSGTAQPVGQG